MLSRVAENIYWMARHIERAENTARLVNVNTFLLLDLPKSVHFGWAPLIEITSNKRLFKKLYGELDERSVVKFLVSDINNPSSLFSSLRLARENVRTIRDIIPREIWEQVNELNLFAKTHASKGLTSRGRYDYLKSIILQTQTLTGLLAGSMLHDEGYDFLRAGRNLERADMTTRIIDVRSADLLPEVTADLAPFENIQWMSVLKSLSAYQMYRRRMQVRVRRPDVLKFLFQERDFPRTVYHCLCEVEDCISRLPSSGVPLKTINELQQITIGAKPEALSQKELHIFIDQLQLGLSKLHDRIFETYFDISPEIKSKLKKVKKTKKTKAA